jgi:hypothetical protein
MTKYFLATLAAVALFSGGCGCSRKPVAWKYDSKLHNTIAKADRVVVYDEGFDPYGNDSKAKALFTLSNADDIKQLAEGLEFQSGQTLGGCPCNGYPRVDWFQGKQRIATIAVQHCKAIRWKGFQADAKLTSRSGEWLQQWLTEHGVDPAKMKLQ